MANYSGVYRCYEGTDAECSGVQLEREATWATDIGRSGSLRYLDNSGEHHYIGTYVDDLYNVNITSPISGEALTYDGSNWINGQAAASLTGLTSGYMPVADSASGISNSILQSSGGDIFSDKWQAYVPTTSGWGAIYATACKYKTIGKTVFLRYSINGSGNADRTSFTIPLVSDENAIVGRPGSIGWMHGTAPIPVSGEVAMSVSANRAYIFDDAIVTNLQGKIWGSGYYKWLCGQFWYQAV